MPTYAYVCAQCNHAFDIWQSFTDAALEVCDRCGGQLRKQYGSIGVTFSGPGFYRTDSRASADGGSGSTRESGDAAASTSTAGSAAPAAATTTSATAPAPSSGSGQSS